MVQYNVKARDGGSCYDRLLVGETKQQLIFEQWEADWGIRNSSPWILIKLETHKLNKTFAFRTEVTHIEYLRQIKFIMIGPTKATQMRQYAPQFTQVVFDPHPLHSIATTDCGKFHTKYLCPNESNQFMRFINTLDAHLMIR